MGKRYVVIFEDRDSQQDPTLIVHARSPQEAAKKAARKLRKGVAWSNDLRLVARVTGEIR